MQMAGWVQIDCVLCRVGYLSESDHSQFTESSSGFCGIVCLGLAEVSAIIKHLVKRPHCITDVWGLRYSLRDWDLVRVAC